MITDIELADGTGLEVVQAVRSTVAHGHVPILILSGSSDPGTVDRAYALGVNSYVVKSPRGRTMADAVRTIYDHWLRDTRLPNGKPHDRTHDVLARATSIRRRIAQQYMAMAERLGGESPPVNTAAFAEAVGLLFPTSPLVVAALLEALARYTGDLVAAVEAHSEDPALREAATSLRENVALLRSLGGRAGVAPDPARTPGG